LWLDARTLTQVDGPAGLRDTLELWVAPGGDRVALRRNDDELEVRDLRLGEITDLLKRPLAAARPVDLAAVAAAQAIGTSPGAREAIGLLRACLEYRFGSDVAVYDVAPTAYGADDIAL
jgi:hypothetical protein